MSTLASYTTYPLLNSVVYVRDMKLNNEIPASLS